MTGFVDAPAELRVCIQEFFPEMEWDNAANIAHAESGWSAFALHDSTSPSLPCGAFLGDTRGIPIVAERSVGYFQINACNFPSWEWQRLYNARHNTGTAHMLWQGAGNSWRPWLLTARALGLVP
jgi:hypothetical protein